MEGYSSPKIDHLDCRDIYEAVLKIGRMCYDGNALAGGQMQLLDKRKAKYRVVVFSNSKYLNPGLVVYDIPKCYQEMERSEQLRKRQEIGKHQEVVGLFF